MLRPPDLTCHPGRPQEPVDKPSNRPSISKRHGRRGTCCTRSAKFLATPRAQVNSFRVLVAVGEGIAAGNHRIDFSNIRRICPWLPSDRFRGSHPRDYQFGSCPPRPWHARCRSGLSGTAKAGHLLRARN